MEWEAREEIEVKVRKYDEMEKRRQEERREEKDEIIIYRDGSKKEEGTAMVLSRVANNEMVI